ncbi:MAG: hypothetical protein JXC32_19035 [Anaerolineae bacterium]|nr:hypothetical protein [Anaerolineae bacterium]
MKSAHALRRRAGLTVLLALLLAFGGVRVAAQETGVLPQLQTMDELAVELIGATALITGNGETTQRQRGFMLSNAEALTAPGGAGLSWDGTRFSTQVAMEGREWRIAGEVSPDGRTLLDLSAYQSLSYCTDPRGCTTPDSQDVATYVLRGPIPLEGPEDWGTGGPRWCYIYAVEGTDVGNVIQEAAHSEMTTGSETRLAYPPPAGTDLPERLNIYFCGTSIPMPQGESQPAASGTWQFQSREVLEPASTALAGLLGSCDLDQEEQWSPVLAVQEASATTQIEVAQAIAQDCIGPGCPSVTLSAAFTWTPPPTTLVPGEQIVVAAAIDSVIYSAPHYGYTKNARVLIYQDTGVVDFDRVDLLSLFYQENNDQGNALGQTYDAPWAIPPGAPGDRLALGVMLSGPAECDTGLVLYHYSFVVLDQLPQPSASDPVEEEPAVAPSEDEIWEPSSGEAPDAIGPDANGNYTTGPEGLSTGLGGIPAGLGDIGLAPGPETLTEALVGIGLPAAVISALSAAGQLLGGAASDVPESPDGPPGGSPAEITLTDALGNNHDYRWDPNQGGYINPQTGGMLNGTLWNEYNRNLASNRAFSDRERQRLENRETEFDHRMDWYNTDRQRERREGLERELRGLEERGYALGEDGARASAHAAALARQVRAGETISVDRALAIDRFIRNREAGRSSADTGERTDVTDWDVRQAQAQALARAAVTGRNEDGSTNWAGIGIRVVIGIVTGGGSEKVFIPASAAYTYYDARNRGQSRSDAALSAAGSALLEVALGKAAQGVAGLGGRVLGTAGQLADEVAPGITNYVRTGVRGLGNELDQLGQGLSSAKQALAQRLGVGGQPALTAAERQLQWRVTKAVAEGADDDLVRTFQGNGRQALRELERHGGLTQQQAQQIRRALANQVDGALDDGAEAAMQRFHERTGIQPQEVLVGDSGSTARGGAFSVANSDFDRTLTPRFAPADIARYAQENGISEAQAVEVLSRRFRATYQREVEQVLRERTGLTTTQVDLNVFDRVRTTARGGDIYPFGYTNARQSAWGRTRVYRPGHRPYNTSGDALVDQNVIEIGRAGQHVPDDPVRATVEELRVVVRHQAAAGNRYTDATSLAKALDRAGEPLQRLRLPNAQTDANLSQIARQIRNNPQQQAQILRQYGMTEQQFVERARAELNRFASLIAN